MDNYDDYIEYKIVTNEDEADYSRNGVSDGWIILILIIVALLRIIGKMIV